MFEQYRQEQKWSTWSGYTTRETVERSNGCVGMSVTQPLLLLSTDAPHRASPISPPFAGTWESKRLSFRFHAEKRQVRWPDNL